MIRFLVAAGLAGVAVPAAADDASDFLTLFERTCAMSLATPAGFAQAAQAAGATLKQMIFRLPEGAPDREWNAIAYWAVDARPRGLTLSMTVHGTAANHGLSCLIYASPHSGLTIGAAIARVRVAMKLGEPDKTTGGAPDGDSGASWTIGAGQDAQRIGISIPSASSDSVASIAVITQEHAP
jgi:hypothetical protein